MSFGQEYDFLYKLLLIGDSGVGCAVGWKGLESWFSLFLELFLKIKK